MRTVDATPGLVSAFLARLPIERVIALEARAGNGPGWAERSIAASDITWCGVDDIGPVYMGGVLSADGPAPGYIWQVVAPDLALHKRAYLELGRLLHTRWPERHPRLWTVIEADYRAAIRHMRRQGFDIAVPAMIWGNLSCLCERMRSHV